VAKGGQFSPGSTVTLSDGKVLPLPLSLEDAEEFDKGGEGLTPEETARWPTTKMILSDGRTVNVKADPASQAQAAKSEAQQAADKREELLRAARLARTPEPVKSEDPKAEYQRRYNELKWRYTIIVVGMPFVIVWTYQLYGRCKSFCPTTRSFTGSLLVIRVLLRVKRALVEYIC
jgi:hypothetical protein